MNVSDVAGWKRDRDGVWHATTAFDGHTFECLCGDEVDNSERGSWQSEKPRGEVALCSDCAERLNQRIATDGAGETIAVSPLTGIIYAATDYEAAGDGKIVADEKRPLSRAEIAARLPEVHGPARRYYREHLGGDRDA